ncbi:MAG: NAD-dependent epimerase/dehydratase family protein [Verrucomicrobiota bacterium]|nr:NAD-dependent epimerase/dehydratase family protein [Verrucomicrobiota bacterium]
MKENYATQYAGKSVAITGAGGYLAPAIMDALGENPKSIYSVSSQDLKPRPGVVNIQADIRSAECWKEIVTVADVIFHLASNTSVYAAIKDPAGCLASTVQPISHLVWASQVTARRPRVVLASTVTQYGITSKFPVAERSPLNPITNYDLQKLFSEEQLLLASNHEIIDGVSLRLANVYGVSSNASTAGDRGVLNKVTRSALEGANLKVYGNGRYIRDYIYITDVAQAFLAAGISESTVGYPYNIGSGRGITIQQAFSLVAKQAERMTGRKVSIENIPWPEDADPIEHRNFVADISAINTATDWSPLISFEQGVNKIIRRFYHNE